LVLGGRNSEPLVADGHRREEVIVEKRQREKPGGVAVFLGTERLLHRDFLAG